MHHRMILIDDLTTGRQTRTELTAEDAAAIYGPERLALLDAGQTIRRENTLHCDMLAFINATRRLPEAMTRRPTPPRPQLACTNGQPVEVISIATDAARLAELAAPTPIRSAPILHTRPRQTQKLGLS